MQSAPRAPRDPDGRLRLLIGGIALCCALAALTAAEPGVGLLTTGLITLVATSVALQRRIGLTALWPLAVVAALQPMNGLRVLPFVAVGDVALIIVVLVAAFGLAQARAIEPLIVMLLGMLIVVAGGTIGMAVAEDPSGAAEMAKFVLGTPVVVLLLMLINPSYRDSVLLMTAYSIGAVISAGFATFEPVDPAFGRSDGLGAHAGHLALSGMLGFFLMLGWMLTSRQRAIQVGAAIAGGICLYSVMLSGTRSAILGVLAGLLFVAIAARWRGVMAFAGCTVAGIALLLLVVPFLPYRNNIERAFGRGELAGGTQMTNSLHADAFRDALRLIGEHPLSGIGFAEGQTAHNMVLQVASMGGLLAVLGLMVIWTPVAFLAFKGVNRGLTRANSMRLCVMAGVVGYFIYAQFQPLIWDRHLWFFVTLAVLLQVSPHRAPAAALKDNDAVGSHT